MSAGITGEIVHADGRVELADASSIAGSPLYNEDLAPVPIARRTWTTYNYAALWISMAHCIPTYMLASGLMNSGMSWKQALFTILLGNTIVLAPILLNSHPGTKYGIPFPVFARAAYGTAGSNLPALMRALVACGWFGIQTWIGGEALHTFFAAVFPGWPALLGAGFAGHTTTEWLSFLLFWGLNIFVIYRGMDVLRKVENWAAPYVLAVTVVLLVWAVNKADGLGPLLAQPGKFRTFREFFPVFIPSLTAMIGFWATLSLNMPDFTRFGRSQREQVVGQAIALPTTMFAFAAMGVLITSASALIFGEAIWDPVKLVGKFTNPLVVAVAMFSVVVATLAVNIAANVVSPANDFANALPRFISFKTGGLITGLLGIAMQPWRLLADPKGYIFTWLLGYSGGLGSIAGVLIADYWVVRKRTLDLKGLYLPNGVYSGWNAAAVVATCAGCFLAWGGLVIPPMKPLYDYAWFVGFFAAGCLYVVLMVGTRRARRISGSFFLSSISFFLSLPLAADDLETTVARMARVGASRSPSFSPDGKTLAFVSNLTGVPQVWTVPAAGGFPSLVTSFDDPVGGVEWSPDGRWIAFTLAPGGGMNTQVYLVRPDGTSLRRLTDGGKETNRLGGFSHDGRLLILGSNRRSGASIDAYLLDVESRVVGLVTQNPGIGGFDDLSRDGRRALLNRLRYRGSNDLFLVDLATKKETLLTPHEGPGSYEGVFSPDGKTIWISSNGGRDKLAFGRIALAADGTPGPIEIVAARDDAELASFAIDDAGERAALVWNAGGRHELTFLDLLRKKERVGPKLPGDIASGLTWSRDGKRLAMSVSGAVVPANIFIFEESSPSSSLPSSFTRITDSPHPGVDLASLVSPELLTFKAHDGEPLSGWLYRPKGAKGPGPVVLSFHGGPEGQEVPLFRADYQALVSRGIAVFAPNVRGSAGFGKRFVNLDNGALRANAVKDIVSCVDAVVKAGVADPKRIGIMGGSYGGYMTMAGLVEYPDLFAAGADLFGVVNFKTFFKHTEPWMAAISKIEYGDPDTEGEMLDRLSPLSRVDRVKAPTIVLHGANDTNVPVIEAEQVVANLEKRGVPVEYVLFPDEGHGFQKLPNRIRSTTAIVEWFSKWLGVNAAGPS